MGRAAILLVCVLVPLGGAFVLPLLGRVSALGRADKAFLITGLGALLMLLAIVAGEGRTGSFDLAALNGTRNAPRHARGRSSTSPPTSSSRSSSGES